MKIEEGKYYRTRDGEKVGPMKYWGLDGWRSDSYERPLSTGVWLDDGTAKYAGAKDSPDLISEWQDEAPSPIRTVTRKEIVAGTYGIVTIKECGFIHINAMGTPEKLRGAAHTLNQIAEALEDD